MKSKLPHLVLVEDDPFIQRMYERALTAAGFDVSLSPDGTILLEVSQLHAPDIILMDVKMPNFNGLETLEELKSGIGTREIPVIMLSAYDDPAIVNKAMALGAEKYLVKSQYEPMQVVDILKQILSNHGKHFEYPEVPPQVS